MTRKLRKQARKRKGKGKPVIERQFKKELNLLAWDIAWEIARNPTRSPDEGKAFICPECKMTYCVPYGIPTGSYFCHECYYVKFNPYACDKRNEVRNKRLCNYCTKKLAPKREKLTILEIIEGVKREHSTG